jgi:hypothetical protein
MFVPHRSLGCLPVIDVDVEPEWRGSLFSALSTGCAALILEIGGPWPNRSNGLSAFRLPDAAANSATTICCGALVGFFSMARRCQQPRLAFGVVRMHNGGFCISQHSANI